MIKKELRLLYKNKRKALSDDEVFQFSKAIFQNFIDFFTVEKGQKIHLFLTIEKLKEVQMSFFIDYFFEMDVRLFVPKIVQDKLIAVEITPQTVYETNTWGISEPISNEDAQELNYDYVLTPLVYADPRGNRVGYGKGFYDSFFSQLHSKVKKVGINYFEPNEPIDDVWENDIPLDYLVSPNRVLSFEGLGK